jgi:hypothetical protein
LGKLFSTKKLSGCEKKRIFAFCSSCKVIIGINDYYTYFQPLAKLLPFTWAPVSGCRLRGGAIFINRKNKNIINKKTTIQ